MPRLRWVLTEFWEMPSVSAISAMPSLVVVAQHDAVALAAAAGPAGRR